VSEAEGVPCDRECEEWVGLAESEEGDLATLGSMGQALRQAQSAPTAREGAREGGGTDEEWDVVSESGSLVSDGSYCLV